MSLYTVFGGTGFIGSEFVNQLEKQGHEVEVINRKKINFLDRNLGVVIYAAGFGDCANDSHNVLDANLTFLASILENAKFEKLIYLSSTRVYLNQECTNEDGKLSISINDSRRLFNLTKIAAEEMCQLSKKDVLIIRPSNVYGLAINSPLFLPSIVRNAIMTNSIDMYVTRNYSKDYVFVGDVVKYTLDLLSKGAIGVFNLASGSNTSAKEIADIIVDKTSCNVNWLADKDIDYFHEIDISKIGNALDYKPNNVIDDLKKMIIDFENHFKQED
ncbi:NAD-dependent epimerase/dehydratase family protein [Vibrio crassostreae]|uniref:NAD-dependent epimerase/dehydratase family protein n=1 Tax=Vibrio crassostreae TaxID=246167 RepID=UPI0010483EE1|nr:NAD(P)-dependent oxidoreductase [Vibrio crassostreae]TCN92776.1 nucleoside-diphosphate-sugar epimerase [Vibrio crassostreae]CAK1928656.1 Nucleoside-diphosphate-sugar epimerase [Vibrio crassostreae]CAK1936453.1 Nucleoside-diphosphate-sugar epimerase [Vibrio crassostreae]CAK1942152.1 Nucleoside-diphosphate-sugar epimerase [Vibrio crassostreae]CAK2715350.1 Nucleoside-diphosphate-sugar epimerase [Vibrio crassostreae]